LTAQHPFASLIDPTRRPVDTASLAGHQSEYLWNHHRYQRFAGFRQQDIGAENRGIQWRWQAKSKCQSPNDSQNPNDKDRGRGREAVIGDWRLVEIVGDRLENRPGKGEGERPPSRTCSILLPYTLAASLEASGPGQGPACGPPSPGNGASMSGRDPHHSR
jgi:hypothetical protein